MYLNQFNYMLKSAINIPPSYFDRYIALNDEITVLAALESTLTQLENAHLGLWQSLGHQIYESGKWTINDILQHVADTERVFSYRAFAIARGEKMVNSFDQNHYALIANANHRNLGDILNEAISIRKSTIALFRSFKTEDLSRTGSNGQQELSVLAIGFIIAGHQIWHQNIITERYLPLLKSI